MSSFVLAMVSQLVPTSLIIRQPATVAALQPGSLQEINVGTTRLELTPARQSGPKYGNPTVIPLQFSIGLFLNVGQIK